MRIGIVSDLHGNAPALERALEAMGRIDELICLGDAINEHRFSNEVVALLRSHDARAIRGNHEEVFFSAGGLRARSAGGIDPAHLAWLADRPRTDRLQRAGRDLLLVHSTPWEPTGRYVCAHDHEFARFGDTGADIVLYGHTHLAVVQQAGRTLVVNPGSAGEPRQCRAGWLCSCAVLDPASLRAEIVEFPA